MRRLLFGAACAVFTACGSTGTPLPVGAPTYAAGQEPPPTSGQLAGKSVRLEGASHLHSARSTRRPTRFSLWRFHAPIVRVHTTGSTLTPPADPHVLGWWGRRAGARHGTTLIVGHSVHTGGGELDTLASTPVGVVAVVSGIRYRVTRVQVIAKAKLARIAPRLFNQHGAPRLVVVSCAAYQWATGVWPANAVVTAKPLNPQPRRTT